MELFGEELVLTGKERVDILRDLRIIEDNTDDGTVLKCSFCEAYIEDGWKACPRCGKTLPQELLDGNRNTDGRFSLLQNKIDENNVKRWVITEEIRDKQTQRTNEDCRCAESVLSVI